MSATSFGANDLDRFRATFFEECAELVADMEARLGGLSADMGNTEELNAIFRAVHSIKAGAGAFGLKRLVTFAHRFEAVLDLLRDGKLIQDDRVTGILVRSGDVLAFLVDASQTGATVADDFGLDVAEELGGLLPDAHAPPAPLSAPAPIPAVAQPRAAATPDVRTYRITFRPHLELLRRANEPLLLVREMKRLGQLTTVCDPSALPDLAVLEPEDCYLAWTFELVTTAPRSAVVDVFEFVDGECFLDIAELPGSEDDGAFGLFPDEGFGIFAEEPDPDVASSGAQTTDGGTATAPAPVTATPAAPTPKAATGNAQPAGGKAAAAQSIRVDLDRVDRLVNVVGELVITQAMLTQQMTDQGIVQSAQIMQGHEDLAMLTRELQECVMAIRMQPVKSVFQRMPRLVREVTTKLDKKVNLVMRGELTEVDKTVIEELADPLTHMIRNSIDHGIERPEDRRARGKPEEGTIELSAAHVGSNILIQIADDGAGINRERLLAKAIEKGIVPANANLADEEIDELIFAPGFSTAAEVTDVSGRGVGMDVVRRNINGLGGRIQVHSVQGQGTRFTLVIPLTLAVLDGMVVATGREKYILPLTSIVESFRPDQKHIRELAGGGQVASIRNEYVRLVYLCKIFNVPGAITEPWKGLVVLVETAGGGKIGIVVDELIGQQQVVIKSLQENFDPVPGISGATILGNGRVALILDIEQLATLAERRHRPFQADQTGSPDVNATPFLSRPPDDSRDIGLATSVH
jgi:two-component system chemotaxis sensor kinase CheA